MSRLKTCGERLEKKEEQDKDIIDAWLSKVTTNLE